ncbi:hypothetical protein T01_7416 [Trichinella spiralis]|uniref:Uncharacterized protein n=1 Tax=Trichinella spiralis TaxID=6334 RepID=A0A0V1B7L8_TRISP|nr:hypothetical protein T01_7416 [Trichinella spiralis]
MSERNGADRVGLTTEIVYLRPAPSSYKPAKQLVKSSQFVALSFVLELCSLLSNARSIPIVLLSVVGGAATSTLWSHPHVSHTLVPIQLSGLIDGSEDILILIASFAVLSRHGLALTFWIAGRTSWRLLTCNNILE